jgi:hypothetical protein
MKVAIYRNATIFLGAPHRGYLKKGLASRSLIDKDLDKPYPQMLDERNSFVKPMRLAFSRAAVSRAPLPA